MLIRLLCSSCGRGCVKSELKRMPRVKGESGEGDRYLACPECKGEVTGTLTEIGWLAAVVWLALGITLVSWVVGKTNHVPMPDHQERVAVRAER